MLARVVQPIVVGLCLLARYRCVCCRYTHYVLKKCGNRDKVYENKIKKYTYDLKDTHIQQRKSLQSELSKIIVFFLLCSLIVFLVDFSKLYSFFCAHIHIKDVKIIDLFGRL